MGIRIDMVGFVGYFEVYTLFNRAEEFKIWKRNHLLQNQN